MKNVRKEKQLLFWVSEDDYIFFVFIDLYVLMYISQRDQDVFRRIIYVVYTLFQTLYVYPTS